MYLKIPSNSGRKKEKRNFSSMAHVLNAVNGMFAAM